MKTIPVETPSGQIIQIEIAEAVPTGPVRQGGGQVAGVVPVEKTIKQLQDVGVAIADVCGVLQDQIQSKLQKAKPSELTLEFSVTLAGETGIPLVTKGTAEGTFKVNAKWRFAKVAADV